MGRFDQWLSQFYGSNKDRATREQKLEKLGKWMTESQLERFRNIGQQKRGPDAKAPKARRFTFTPFPSLSPKERALWEQSMEKLRKRKAEAKAIAREKAHQKSAYDYLKGLSLGERDRYMGFTARVRLAETNSHSEHGKECPDARRC